MQKIALFFLFSFAIFSTQAAPDAAKGKKLFEATCTSCHKVGGDLIGPNLAGVKSRWNGDMKKITAWVHDPSKFLGKDPYVMKLQQKFNSAMTPQSLNDAEVADVIEYANAPTVGDPTADGGGVSKEAFMSVPADPAFLRWLFFGALVLVLIIVYLASRIYNSFRDKDAEDHDGFDGPAKGWNWQKINAWMMPIFFVIFMGGLLYECTIHLTPKYLLPPSASDIGVEIERLFLNTVYVTAIVFFITQILLFYYCFKYQKKEGRKAFFYSHNNTVEFVWTTIPAIVLSFLVLDGFKVWRTATANPDNNPFVVEAFAKQFEWTFRYPGGDGKLGKTDFRKISATNPLGIDFDDPASKDDYITKELHMVDKREVKMKLRSQDVIHAAYLPHFRMQLYCQPGMDNQMRFTPIYTTEAMRAKVDNSKFDYELACNQLCGSAHYNMRRIVVVEDQKAFDKWASTFKAAITTYKPEPAEAGKPTASLK